MACPGCGLKLIEPFIRCAECLPTVEFCLQCFAKGREFYDHASHHNYEIKNISFPLFNKNWSAREELQLLDATEEYGFGNWNEISKKVQTKSSEDCEKHYSQYYIENPVSPLPQFHVNQQKCFRRPLVFKTSEQPPRPDETRPDDVLYPAGYMAARGDFIVEHDNFAEGDIKDVCLTDFADDEPDDLLTELKFIVGDIYLRRLRERNVRKKIVKDYGLLDISTMNALSFKHGASERHLRDNFRKFARLMEPEEHEKLIQSILYQKYLESRITHLQEYRRHGLKYFRDVSYYVKLKKRRKTLKPTVFKLDEALLHIENPVACRIWLQRQLYGKKSCVAIPNLPQLHRKPSAPLDLTGLPGVEQLSKEEKELCSSLRLLPESYMAHRATLQKESFLSNGVKLQTARNILKIDVNKTRRLYEFLLNQGLIKVTKPITTSS